MKIATQASVRIARPVEEVFDFAVVPEGFSRFLLAFGPIPAVTRSEMVGGVPMARGARRLVSLSDGSSLEEEILELERPRTHGYRWQGPPLPFSLIVRSGEAHWTFTPDEGGTRVDWSYSFELTTVLVYPLGLAVAALFRRWMSAGLGRLRDLLVT